MTTLPGSLLPWLDRGFRTLDTDLPLVGGWVEFFVHGDPSTHKAVFASADSDPTGVLPNPVPLDSTGRATIFLEAGAYDVSVFNSAMVLQYTVEGVEDIGNTFLSTFVPPTPPPTPALPTTGARNVTSGYTVLDTDQFITVNGTGGPDPCVIHLPAVTTRTLPICLKNLGNVRLAVTPNGGEHVDGTLTTYQIEAAGSPNFPTAWLFPDPPGATWWVFSRDENIQP